MSGSGSCRARRRPGGRRPAECGAGFQREERAKRLGIPKVQLITPQEEMAEEFSHAERRLIKSIKQGTIQSELPILSIPDVVGIKLITEPHHYERMAQVLRASPSCRLLEEEEHSGNYNAINLRVAHMIPRHVLAAHPPTGESLRVLASRGFDPSKVAEQYREFLDTAEDHVLLEIIVASYQEFLESEIGRSMHEDRVLTQRANLEYNSHMATNVRYLMDYMLALCLAPGQDGLMDVPIKLWVKYMPDTMDRMTRGLFHVPTDSSFDINSNSNFNSRVNSNSKGATLKTPTDMNGPSEHSLPAGDGAVS